MTDIPVPLASEPTLGGSYLTELTATIKAFVGTPGQETGPPATFDELALRSLKLQAVGLPGYLRLFQARGIKLDALKHWRDAPPIPTSAFKNLTLTLGKTERVFRSSGTLGGTARSEHHHCNLDLYRFIIETTFPPAVLGQATHDAKSNTPILSLIPPLGQVPDSSLSFMTQEVMRRYGNQQSCYAFSDGSLDFPKALTWLARRASEQTAQIGSKNPQSPMLMTTALALWELLGEHQRSCTASSSWPDQLTIMETGGFKTLRFELHRDQLLHRLTSLTGTAPSRVVREYGMTELTSQAYTQGLREGGDPNTFSLPHWVKARALDPFSMQEVGSGEEGLLSFLDLGNVGSAVSLLTEDLGTVGPEGNTFQLHGRAEDAQLRGCSLTTETLLP